MTKSIEDIQLFLHMKHRMFWPSGEYKYMIFALCNVRTALDPPLERLSYKDFNGGFCFKGE
jgi:hypothetical protein